VLEHDAEAEDRDRYPSVAHGEERRQRAGSVIRARGRDHERQAAAEDRTPPAPATIPPIKKSARLRGEVQAREQLRTAHRMLIDMGMEAFAERAPRELVATGETIRKRQAETRDELTPQEERIARLARERLSNPEIGERLFLSPRTVEWHLKKVFHQARDQIAHGTRRRSTEPRPGRRARVRHPGI
jgi:DNA-binding CsgD family transcriptional regulator